MDSESTKTEQLLSPRGVRTIRSSTSKRAKPGSGHTARGAILVASGIFLSRIAGLIRDRVFAHYFGNSDAADAFKAAFRIPNFLQNLFGEGALSASMIPVYAGDETWRAEGEVEEPAIGARRRAKQETHRAVKSVWELCRTAQWCDAADAGRSRHNHLSRDASAFRGQDGRNASRA